MVGGVYISFCLEGGVKVVARCSENWGRNSYCNGVLWQLLWRINVFIPNPCWWFALVLLWAKKLFSPWTPSHDLVERCCFHRCETNGDEVPPLVFCFGLTVNESMSIQCMIWLVSLWKRTWMCIRIEGGPTFSRYLEEPNSQQFSDSRSKSFQQLQLRPESRDELMKQPMKELKVRTGWTCETKTWRKTKHCQTAPILLEIKHQVRLSNSFPTLFLAFRRAWVKQDYQLKAA